MKYYCRECFEGSDRISLLSTTLAKLPFRCKICDCLVENFYYNENILVQEIHGRILGAKRDFTCKERFWNGLIDQVAKDE